MEVSGLAVGADRTSVVSRGTDGTVKVGGGSGDTLFVCEGGGSGDGGFCV